MVALVGIGCNSQSSDEAKLQAHKRWDLTRAKVIVSLANHHLEVGELEKARNKAAEAMAMCPDLVQARVVFSKALIEQGQYQRAVGELTHCCEQDPNNSETSYLLGVALERQRQPERALEAYLRAHSLDEKNLDAVVAAGEVMVSMGQSEQAYRYIQQFVNQPTLENAALFGLAGRVAMLQKEYAPAATYFQAACDLDGQNVQYVQWVGRAHLLAGNYFEAIDSFERLREDPDNQPPAWMYSMLGDSYMAIGKPHKARRIYEEAQKHNPESPRVWCDLARANLALNDTQRAILCARQGHRLDEHDLDATMMLGYSLLKSKQVRESIEVLSKAASMNESSSMLYCLLGRAYAAAGNRDKARECYRKAYRIDPQDPLAKELLGEREVEKLSKAD
jgi:tetratricopeptide (TPR) repeat protein